MNDSFSQSPIKMQTLHTAAFHSNFVTSVFCEFFN